ncbi:zinc ribbon domain-containing protein [Pseudomonas aeruginosa]|uniref:zinc ribbon domain-containing protein n=1 Tax=Pseudomonas aeruginosa TaxID=287 RepID=UPI0008A97B50|nr:zinc ribbon domain-containing protein [Pseudomonas aeruginosa]OHP18375.1 hypothetical protein HMPREF2687_03380 [Pseudomonas aeruginosa]OHP41695.1 hypothetical protein HMPREF2583_00715 [Pseudomonas aeruginosa]
MSSTQHQLIEQCATRLRGIVEALDNIHDTSPHRWSTDLDDVHSSAESLLALIKDQAPARSEASFEEWLANELEGEDGQPVPAAVCDIALARRAFNHWPKLEQPAKVGSVRFSAGVSSRLVVEAAQRLYEFESTPEQEAERIERLQAFREQLDPLNVAPHAEAFNEAPDEAIRPEQAEAERPEVVAFRYHCTNAEGEPLPGWFYSDDAGTLGLREPLMTVAQHERIVGARWNRAMDLMGEHVARISEKFKAERDAALARVAELESATSHIEVRQCVNCRHVGINDAADYAACHDCRWTGPEPDEDKCPGCGSENCMAAACPECGGRYELVAEANIATPVAQGGQVPQAWLDVQAERRRQIEAKGWTPEHDDLYCSAELPRAAAAYILNGANDEAPAIWPFVAKWWKPRDARSNYVRAGALILAEIERLDRAAANQGGPRDA